MNATRHDTYCAGLDVERISKSPSRIIPLRRPTQPNFYIRSDVESLFEEAITRGQFGIKPERADYVGDWMYMGTVDGVDSFKHVLSRLYWPKCPTCRGCGRSHEGPVGELNCGDCGGSGKLEVSP